MLESSLLASQQKTNQKKNTSPSFFFQPKLTINQSNDVYEQEADAIAEKMMRMPSGETNLFFRPAASTAQRKCAECEKEEKQQGQRKEMNQSATTKDQPFDDYVSGLSGGHALSNKTTHFFESRMGYNFSQVQVHTDSVAAESAQSINALAYTTGNHIVFNTGQYSPDTENGKRLLGHELTHVVQQQNGISPKRIQRLVTDEDLAARADMAAAVPSSCGSSYQNCYGRCRAADGSVGSCQWGGVTYGCRCRSHRGDEPAPVARPVPFWVYALGGAAAIAIAACFATGVCEVGAIIAAVGEAGAAAIMALLRAAGILITE